MLLHTKHTPHRHKPHRHQQLLRDAKEHVRRAYRERRGRGAGTPAVRAERTAEPDVFLDVPTLHIDEIDLELDDLAASVSLGAHVLDLLKLDVGADARLGQVKLRISGVDAQAQLQVRLGHVAAIVDRVMTTLDRNPQVVERLVEGVGGAVNELGTGAGRAVGEVGAGAGQAVGEVGSAVGDVGSAARALAGDGAQPPSK